LKEIRDSANKVIDTKNEIRGTSQGKKRPITAVVAGAKNLRTL
jgi:hypothetical protein